MIGQIAASRPSYYDRNPVTRALQHAGPGTAPHGTTQRWTYTVPTGKKAFVEYAWARISRRTVGAPVGLWETFARITPSGGSATVIFDLLLITNLVGDRDQLSSANYGGLNAGDMVENLTADASTGGTVDYSSSLKATEFDA